jgi:sulfide:quinone oxidoreductase
VVGMNLNQHQPFRVLIAGGGVAALEAALALRDLAGDRVKTTLLAPEPEFVYRPMRVLEPFSFGGARRYGLDQIARDIDVELLQDGFRWLEPAASVVHTERGATLEYDALLLALGARLKPPFRHARTIDDRRLDEDFHGLVQDVEEGYVRSVAFVASNPMAWPLPMYELALMTARRGYDMGVDLSVTIVTPEDAPLAVFGSAVSDAVGRLLEVHGVMTITSAHCAVPKPKRVQIHPGGRMLHVDSVVALPQLFGQATPGVPKRDGHGFIPVDVHGKVPGLERVFAAGDATDFAVKHGGIAAQQADVAAEAIAALAGAPVEPTKFHPVIHGMFLGGDRPLYLSAHITGGHGSSSEVGEEPTWSPATKIAARYLAPYIESRDRAALR